ncbi:MAG: hypothetical protein ACXAES_16250, partial [Promethearchaeota archaeon]
MTAKRRTRSSLKEDGQLKKHITPITPFVIFLANIVIILTVILITTNIQRFSLIGVIKVWAFFGFFFMLSIGLWRINWAIIYASTMACMGMFIIVIYPHFNLGTMI